MIIVSQDKKILFPFNRAVFVVDDSVFVNAENNGCFFIGEYKTEERAKEELHGIIKALNRGAEVYYMSEEY